jgi:hypothetical protein
MLVRPDCHVCQRQSLESAVLDQLRNGPAIAPNLLSDLSCHKQSNWIQALDEAKVTVAMTRLGRDLGPALSRQSRLAL